MKMCRIFGDCDRDCPKGECEVETTELKESERILRLLEENGNA